MVNDRFELQVESVEPINVGTSFLEIWGASIGADIFYRWVLQSGSGTMQGYRGGEGFTSLGTLDVSFEVVILLFYLGTLRIWGLVRIALI